MGTSRNSLAPAKLLNDVTEVARLLWVLEQVTETYEACRLIQTNLLLYRNMLNIVASGCCCVFVGPVAGRNCQVKNLGTLAATYHAKAGKAATFMHISAKACSSRQRGAETAIYIEFASSHGSASRDQILVHTIMGIAYAKI